MTDNDHKRAQGGRIEQRDELDRALDEALAMYSAVEPRGGLEERVLANLRARSTLGAGRSWRQWAAVGVLAAGIIVAAAIALRPAKLGRDEVKKNPPTPATPRHEKQKFVANRPGSGLPDPGHVKPVAIHAVRPATNTASAAMPPKLERFPSPQPLSEQEKILANYIAQYPEHAALIAEARTDELRRDEEEWHGTGAENDSALKPNR